MVVFNFLLAILYLIIILILISNKRYICNKYKKFSQFFMKMIVKVKKSIHLPELNVKRYRINNIRWKHLFKYCFKNILETINLKKPSVKLMFISLILIAIGGTFSYYNPIFPYIFVLGLGLIFIWLTLEEKNKYIKTGLLGVAYFCLFMLSLILLILMDLGNYKFNLYHFIYWIILAILGFVVFYILCKKHLHYW
ncbi:hypothetical protein [Staphylococcus agnetis]|uniref:hypothetical protein n=1 Tax=Staphylococcus agnetis TaxID=985762 RepID=UPI0014311558|nr:hypothetical protein [Staphylococcus agnetis]NJH96960.1 hypothetical protein [Staphylococcus agnetis]